MILQYWFMFPISILIATVAISSGVGGATFFSPYFARFTQAGSDVLQLVFNVVIFTVPGVIIGGQLGTVVAGRISQRTMELGVAVLFILVAMLTLGEVVL